MPPVNAGVSDVWPFRRRNRSAQRDEPVSARVVRARLETLIDRDDAVFERLAKRLDQLSPPQRKEG